MDGLELYGSEYLHIRFRSALLEKVAKLETKAQSLAQSRLSRAEFADKHALLVGRFLLGVQNLLAATSTEKNDYVLWTSRLSNQDFAKLIWDFYQVPHKLDKVSVLAQFLESWSAQQPYFSPAALRSLTMLARMLDPANWGFLGWRTLACLGYHSMTELKQVRLHNAQSEVQDEFAAVTAQDIVAAMERMRTLIRKDLPTAASVAAALYCISLDLWPKEADYERPDPLASFVHTTCESHAATV
ncbi:MAG TPA: hypothetical protein VFO10_15565 [Oligoflexus sp.]|uniref:hypothetical protein n=1 Tax=Oligoflexus sp. TaxID=1971216 RepID=UPI002D80734E|nr:hypothetical protein [Oligoflexus sp.]HET9238679.1 hypothetical protein [Oligoflexus sp.]